MRWLWIDRFLEFQRGKSARSVKNLSLAWVYRANRNQQGAQTGGSVPEAIPFRMGPGALAGGYVGATAQATIGAGGAVNVLVGGGSKQISLQPVSVEGSTGLNVAGGLAEVELKYVK